MHTKGVLRVETFSSPKLLKELHRHFVGLYKHPQGPCWKCFPVEADFFLYFRAQMEDKEPYMKPLAF